MRTAPTVRFLLHLILELASRNGTTNHSEYAMVSHFVSCKSTSQTTCDGTAQATLALWRVRVIAGSVRVVIVRSVGVLIALRLLARGAWLSIRWLLGVLSLLGVVS